MENWLSNLKHKISDQLSNNPNTKKLVNELEKISQDLKSKSKKINHYLNSEKAKTLKTAEGKYHSLLKQVNLTQKQLDKEVKKALVQIKTSAQKVEKNLDVYKKQALVQKNKLQKKWFQNKPPKASTPVKKTSKKKAPGKRKVASKK